jgi:hypothetical protein
MMIHLTYVQVKNNLFTKKKKLFLLFLIDDPCRINDRAFRAAFARYKFPVNGRIPFSAPTTTIGQLIPENESAACLSNGASCLRVRVNKINLFIFNI